MVLQELEGHEKTTVVFDDNADVWDKHWGNLIPVPPYCYWQGDTYWDDAYLVRKAHVLNSFDERIDNGPLCVAWNITLSLYTQLCALLQHPVSC